MKLTVLGCGTSLSGGDKAGSGYLVNNGSSQIVFDMGYGAHKNLQRATDFCDVNTVFFSHFHPDHCYDLGAFLDQRMGFVNKGLSMNKSQVNLFGPEGLKDFYSSILKTIPFLENMQFMVSAEEGEHFSKKIFGFSVKSKPVKHAVKTIGYRIKSGNKTIAYPADTGYCSEAVDLSKEADLLVLECCVPDEKPMSVHLTPSECARIASEAKPKKILLTHFFPANDEEKAKSIVQKKFNGEVLIAKDLMEIEV